MSPKSWIIRLKIWTNLFVDEVGPVIEFKFDFYGKGWKTSKSQQLSKLCWYNGICKFHSWCTSNPFLLNQNGWITHFNMNRCAPTDTKPIGPAMKPAVHPIPTWIEVHLQKSNIQGQSAWNILLYSNKIYSKQQEVGPNEIISFASVSSIENGYHCISMYSKRRNYFVVVDRSSETQGWNLFVQFDVGWSGWLLEGKSILGIIVGRNYFAPEIKITL